MRKQIKKAMISLSAMTLCVSMIPVYGAEPLIDARETEMISAAETADSLDLFEEETFGEITEWEEAASETEEEFISQETDVPIPEEPATEFADEELPEFAGEGLPEFAGGELPEETEDYETKEPVTEEIPAEAETETEEAEQAVTPETDPEETEAFPEDPEETQQEQAALQEPSEEEAAAEGEEPEKEEPEEAEPEQPAAPELSGEETAQDPKEPEDAAPEMTEQQESSEEEEETSEEESEEESKEDDAELFAEKENSCGEKAVWELKNGVLTISGTGAMTEFASYQDSGWYANCTEIEEIVVESGITYIGSYSFANCSNATKVTLPSTVSGMGEGVFYGCSSLTSVVLPNAVTVLRSGTFAKCYSLQDVVMKGVTQIEDYAFQGTGLKTLRLGKNITALSDLALYGTKLESYEVEAGNPAFTSVDGVLYSADRKTLISYPAWKAGTTFAIPSGVTVVQGGAFIKNHYIVNLTIPEGVQVLGESAFQEMGALTSVRIPDSVTQAGDFTFYGCGALESLTFGKGLQTTSYLMFENCGSLKSINWGGLQEIGSRAFSYCYSLQSIHLPKTIKKVLNGAFGECTGITDVTAEGLQVIAYQAFFNCRSLTSLNLNEGLEYIYTQAFYGCANLARVNLPSTIREITSEAFPQETELVNSNPDLEGYGKNGYMILDHLSVSGTRKYDYAYQVLNLVNQERKKEGAPELVMEETLLESAMVRAAEQTVLFSHTRPDGTLCFTINSRMTAENIAAGQTSPKSVMESWMNSPGHKQNILDANSRSIGIGCFEMDGVLYWAQCFSTAETQTKAKNPGDAKDTRTVQLRIDEFTEAQAPGTFVFGPTDSYAYKIILNGDTSCGSGETVKLTARLVGGIGQSGISLTGENVVYESSNPKVATVSKDGTVKGLSAGSTTITAKTPKGHFSAKLKFTVTAKKVVPKVTLSYETLTYNGKVRKPKVTVTVNGKKLSADSYTVEYEEGCKLPGTYKVKVTLKGSYSGSKTVSFQILKAKNPMTVKAAKKTVKYASVKKKAVTCKAITVENAKGTVTYQKTKGNSKITVNSKTGKITVKKGLKKGTYTVKVKVTAKGNKNYKKLSKTVTLKIVVK